MNWPLGGGVPFNGYENSQPTNVAYRLRIALDRENRLNNEELRAYEDTLIELEFGASFFQRAHP